MQSLMKSRIKITENVEVKVSHCERCAKDNADREAGINVVELCPQRGTLHGTPRKLFQPNALLTAMLKRGIVSPDNKKFQVAVLFGDWTYRMQGSNLVTTVGKAGAAGRLMGSGSPAAFLQIGIGTGTASAAAGDTTLGTEVDASGAGASGVHALSSSNTTPSLVTTSTTNDTAQLTGTISITGNIAVTESGVFNANTNGTLLARKVFSAINVISGDSLQLTWKIQES